MAAIRRLPANPELGEFRIHATLAQLGIDRSPRTCGRILALHRALGAPLPTAATPHDARPITSSTTPQMLLRLTTTSGWQLSAVR